MAFLDQEYTEADLPTKSERNFDPLPDAWYSSRITGAELKSTRAPGGQYIAIKYDITGPTHQGRVVFGNLNIKNSNPAAETIGRQQLGEIMRAIGLARVKDTDELIGGSLQIKLVIKQDEKYGPSNEIKGFKAVTGSMPASVGGSGPAQQAAAAPAKSAPPWAKK